MRALSAILLLFCACPSSNFGLVDHWITGPLALGEADGGGSDAALDGGGADAGELVRPDAGAPEAGVTDGGGQGPVDGGAADAGANAPAGALSEVFWEQPAGSYEVVQSWGRPGGPAPPEYEGMVFADHGGILLMRRLLTCEPLDIVGSWALQEDGRVTLHRNAVDVAGSVILGAVRANGDIEIRFPRDGGGAIVRPSAEDCHRTESHLGAWARPLDRCEWYAHDCGGVVLTEDLRFVEMASLDPCLPDFMPLNEDNDYEEGRNWRLAETSYTVSGPWLTVQGLQYGSSMLRGPLTHYVHGSRLFHSNGERPPFARQYSPLDRSEACPEGLITPPPAELVGTWEVIEGYVYWSGGRGRAGSYFALSNDGTMEYLRPDPGGGPSCVGRYAQAGRYTANDVDLIFKTNATHWEYQGRSRSYRVEGDLLYLGPNSREVDLGWEELGRDTVLRRTNSDCHEVDP